MAGLIFQGRPTESPAWRARARNREVGEGFIPCSRHRQRIIRAYLGGRLEPHDFDSRRGRRRLLENRAAPPRCPTTILGCHHVRHADPRFGNVGTDARLRRHGRGVYLG